MITIKNKAYASAMALILCAASSAAFSATKFVPLEDLPKQGGSGEVAIERIERMGRMPAQMALGINVFHLKPGSVYSVWVVPEGSEEPRRLGVDTNHFKTDSRGNGRFVTIAMEYEIDGWRYLLIYRHPDGDPGNTGDMSLELRGDFRYGWHY